MTRQDPNQNPGTQTRGPQAGRPGSNKGQGQGETEHGSPGRQAQQPEVPGRPDANQESERNKAYGPGGGQPSGRQEQGTRGGQNPGEQTPE